MRRLRPRLAALSAGGCCLGSVKSQGWNLGKVVAGFGRAGCGFRVGRAGFALVAIWGSLNFLRYDAAVPVNSHHADYDAALSDWQRARDVVGGEDLVKAAGDKYIARLDSQTEEDFAVHPRSLSLAGWFPGSPSK